MQPPELTAPGDAQDTCPPRAYYVNPPSAIVLNYSADLLVKTHVAGTELAAYYAGKHSLFGPTPRDPTSWNSESLARFREHKRAGNGNKISVVVAVYENETAALVTEERLATELSALTGLTSLNAVPYSTGKKSTGRGTGFAVYVQAR